MGKGNTSTTTTGPDPASQAAIDRMRQQAQQGAGVATGTPGDFFLGADPRSVQEIIQPFMNPFQSQVIDATRGEFDFLRGGATRAANQAATRAGAFGGARHGVAEGTRLGALDRAQTSQIAGLLSQNFQQAVQQGIPFAERQRALEQQPAQEPLFRQQQALNFMNLGLGPTGTQTTTETSGDLFGDLIGGGLAVGGLLSGGALPAGLSAASAAGIIPEDLFAGQRFGGQF